MLDQMQGGVAQFRGFCQLLAPRLQIRHLAHQDMRGLIEIIRHLHREHPARRERSDQPLQVLQMLRHPLKYRIGEHDIGPARRNPMRNIGFDKRMPGQALACLPLIVRDVTIGIDDFSTIALNKL